MFNIVWLNTTKKINKAYHLINIFNQLYYPTISKERSYFMIKDVKKEHLYIKNDKKEKCFLSDFKSFIKYYVNNADFINLQGE